MRALIVVLLMSQAAWAIPGKNDIRPKVMTPKEMIAFIEKSPRQYEVKQLEADDDDPEQVLSKLYPVLRDPVADPTVKIVNGDRRIESVKLDPKVLAILERAEKRYEKEDYAGAEKIAEEASVLDPKSYRVWLYRGDCALFSGNAEGALMHYEQAAALNPYDHRVHFYRGNALVRLGRMAEAKKAFARSLALKPRNPLLESRIRKDSGLSFTLVEPLFRPRVKLQKLSAEKVIVAVKPDSHWMAYGLCKAMWLMEPERRKEVTGRDDHSFTLAEERECVASAVVVHAASKEKKGKRDEGLDRALPILEAGYLNELLVYELGSRVHEQVTLLLTEDQLDRMAEFVERFLFVKR